MDGLVRVGRGVAPERWHWSCIFFTWSHRYDPLTVNKKTFVQSLATYHELLVFHEGTAFNVASNLNQR